MLEPHKIELDLVALTLTTRTKENFTIKTTYYSSRKELLTAAKAINNSLLRTLELKNNP